MKKTARIIITTKCLKNCENCCNTNEILASATKIKEIPLGFDEYLITGGEPSLYPGFINWALCHMPRNAKKYLYTARWSKDIEEILENWIDGVHYTLHKDCTAEDQTRFRWFQEWAEIFPDKSFRLYMETGINTPVLLNPWLYSRIEMFSFKEDCPLPANETLFILES